MVAAVDGVHEGDAVGTIGEAQPHNGRIEIDGAVDIGGEYEHMREAARAHARRLRAHRCARHAFRR